MGEGNGVDGVDHTGGAEQRIPAKRHRQGSRVAFFSRYRHLEAALSLGTHDYADGLAFGFEYRSLLDVGLEERPRRIAARRLASRVAGGLQGRGHGHAVRIGAREGVLERVDAGENPRPQHAGEAHAFLVRPHHDVDGRPRGDACVVHGAYRFESGKHAVYSVELAAQGLRVEMAAGHHARIYCPCDRRARCTRTLRTR